MFVSLVFRSHLYRPTSCSFHCPLYDRTLKRGLGSTDNGIHLSLDPFNWRYSNIEWNTYPHNLWENTGSLEIPLRIKAFLFQDWLSMTVKRNCVALQTPWRQLNPTWTLNIKTCNHCKTAMPLNVIRLQITTNKWDYSSASSLNYQQKLMGSDGDEGSQKSWAFKSKKSTSINDLLSGTMTPIVQSCVRLSFAP